ncbi:5-oxoprolinase subunit PxpB [Oceanicoccus sagamiensis]|uniref:Allophanate hydrolase n=1 Tax=Oceanicoccus sagamiensis TaxID=716816 RepID=A0A1X9N6H2_9GAMM|nr:5-oxoprolinase subunit PxpB [Oceanicoccus sagamiensis]ARN72851.1 allophanate hydrolase [Oceanicoccus sagamiensis]
MKIELAGENALIIYFGDELYSGSASPDIAARVQAATAAIAGALQPVLIDLIPSYASLTVIYNALKTDHFHMLAAIKDLLADTVNAESGEGSLITLPVYYSLESGPELESIAERAELSIEQVIDLHQQQEYRVYAIGFAPGFAYLGEVDQQIASPRLSTPRQKVPRGAVGIADQQTAVYPAESPGGWNLIGLCPQRMFDPKAQPTMPVAVGDRVRFEAINRDQFLTLGGRYHEHCCQHRF